MVVTYASTYVLVALSIDRYDAITHPMNFSGSCKLFCESDWFLLINQISREASKVSCCCSLDPKHCIFCSHHILLQIERDRAVWEPVLDRVSWTVALEVVHDSSCHLFICNSCYLHRSLLLRHCHHHLEEGEGDGASLSYSVFAPERWEM